METSSVAEFSIEKAYKTDTGGPVRWIFSHGIRYWWLIALALIGAFGNAALGSLAPILVGNAVNVVSVGKDVVRQLGNIALLIGGTQLLRGILQLTRSVGFEIVAQKMERDVRNDLYTSLLGKSMTFHSLQSIGDIMARATNDVREINFLFSPGLNMVLGSLNFIIMPFIIAPSYHPSLLLSPIIYVILYIVSLWHYLKSLDPITKEVRSAFGRLNIRLNESLDGIEIVKGSCQEEAEIKRFSNNAFSLVIANIKQGDLEAVFIPALLFTFIIAGGFLHAMILFTQGILNIGQVTGYVGVLGMLGFPTWVSRFAYSRISLGIAGAKRILELINAKNDLDQNIIGYAKPMQGEIEFSHVSFKYSGGKDQYALQDISFKAKPGQTIAVVGQTGSGKTTLAKLVNRTFDATSGQVFIDGVNVKDWNLEALRRSISIIEQDIFLFSRSIAENIAFGKPSATQEEIEAAAKAAQAHEFIMSFDEGYKTIIGERGLTLSGGQRQRIALARAFLTDPQILILDDSTSSIDSATEDKIQQAIYAASRGRTTIIITHRLSQIRWADLILVLRNGKLAATGSHEELMRTSEAYRRIFSE